MRALPRTRSAVCAVALLGVLTACSSDELDVDGFAAGDCTEVAPALQQVDEALRSLEDEELDPREATVRIRGIQDQLKPVVEAGGDVAEPVQDLVQSLGFFRISVDTNNLDEDLSTNVRESVDGVVASCTS